jgi:hypothetical protein
MRLHGSSPPCLLVQPILSASFIFVAHPGVAGGVIISKATMFEIGRFGSLSTDAYGGGTTRLIKLAS